ncbi:hypothetical protein MK163_16965, partial [bacterium]|nr:hypothetical protein [bacterium]
MPTIPAGPIAVDPTAETTTGLALPPRPPQPPPESNPMKIRMAISKVKKAAHRGKPAWHLPPVVPPP